MTLILIDGIPRYTDAFPLDQYARIVWEEFARDIGATIAFAVTDGREWETKAAPPAQKASE